MKADYRRFFKLKPSEKAKRSFLIGAIDIETGPHPVTGSLLGGPYVYGTVYHESWEQARGFMNPDDLWDFILSHDEQMLDRTVWYSHNAEFDWQRLVEYFKKFEGEMYFDGAQRMEGKFYQLTLKRKDGGKVTTLRDSLALYPHGLKDFAKAFATTQKGDTPLPFDPTNVEHIRYAYNDVICLVEALQGFDDKLYSLYGVHIKGTTAATAFSACLRFLPDGEVYGRASEYQENWFRSGYYGGRVQISALRQKYECAIHSFDINSSYPAQMRKGVPKGKPRDTREYVEGKPGFYEAIVTMPPILLPFIPHKNEHHQLSFPTGKPFRTFVTSLELDHLVYLGGSFEVVEGMYFPEGLCFPFGDFVDICENTRRSFKKTPTETVIKLIQNSVYGKFGTRPEGDAFIISYSNAIPDGYTLTFDAETGETVPYVYSQPNPRNACYMLPHWAGWITAHARLALDRFIRTAGAENVLYIDTDSVKVNPEGAARIQWAVGAVGSVYGQLKYEHEIKEFVPLSPKVYVGLIKGKTGDFTEFLYANKGQPVKQMTEAKLRALHRGENIVSTWDSATSLTTYFRTGERSVMRKRGSTNVMNVYGHEFKDNRFGARQATEADLLSLKVQHEF